MKGLIKIKMFFFFLPCCYIPPRSCPKPAESVYQAGRSSSWRKPSMAPRIYKSLSSYRAATSSTTNINNIITSKRGLLTPSILLEQAARKVFQETKIPHVSIYIYLYIYFPRQRRLSWTTHRATQLKNPSLCLRIHT